MITDNDLQDRPAAAFPATSGIRTPAKKRLVSVAIASGSRIVAGTIGIASLVAAVTIFALILRSPDFAERAGERTARMAGPARRILRKGPAEGWGRATVKFRDRVVGLVRHSWMRLTVTSLVGHFSLFAVLLVTLRDIGVSQDEVGWIEALAVFAFVRLLTAVPLMPGGLGIVELGLIGGLTVTLLDACDVAGAIEVPTDKPGTIRYDAMPDVAGGFRGVRSYVFDGGCATYRFDIESQRAGVLVDEGAMAVGFLSRDEVRARMERGIPS